MFFLKQAFFALTSSTENEVFAHYIFMENAFSLSTASGLPLKFSMAGVFAPGAKGGLTYSFANVSELLVNQVYTISHSDIYYIYIYVILMYIFIAE